MPCTLLSESWIPEIIWEANTIIKGILDFIELLCQFWSQFHTIIIPILFNYNNDRCRLQTQTLHTSHISNEKMKSSSLMKSNKSTQEPFIYFRHTGFLKWTLFNKLLKIHHFHPFYNLFFLLQRVIVVINPKSLWNIILFFNNC